MKYNVANHNTFWLTLLLPLVLTVATSGCALLGLGAAAGAAVGGCSMLDTDEDEMISEMELSAGLFDDWDADGDDELTEQEFDVGAQASGAFTVWSGGFESWDENDDDRISEEEFEEGVARNTESDDWADRQCDELGL